MPKAPSAPSACPKMTAKVKNARSTGQDMPDVEWTVASDLQLLALVPRDAWIRVRLNWHPVFRARWVGDGR